MKTLNQQQQQYPTLSTQSGFTLIECLLAIIIVAVLLAAVAPAIVLSAGTRLQARRVEQATQAARFYVDGLRAGTIPPPYNVYYLNQDKSSSLDSAKHLFTGVTLPSSGSITCPLAPTTAVQPTLANADQFYCKDAGNLWRLYCVELDGDGSACGRDSRGQISHKDMIVQSVRSITIPPRPAGSPAPDYANLPFSQAEADKGYILGIRVYRADAFDGTGNLRTTPLDPQGRAKRQLAYTAGVGDRQSPLLELTTEISPKAQSSDDQSQRWKSLCERFGGCTAPSPSPSP